MKYAIRKERDCSDYVIHSSGPWKQHKYLKKIGDGANAIYQYADDKIGVTARHDYKAYKYREDKAKDFYNRKKRNAKRWYPANDRESKEARKEFVSYSKKDLDRKTKQRKRAEEDYEETALGKVHKAHKRAARKVIKILEKLA